MPWAADYSRASAEEYLAGSVKDWDEGTAYNYAIVTGDALAGSIGLMTRCGPGGLEIGYWVRSAYTGRGLATAATAALVGQAFGLPGVDWVEIVHDELNVASGQIPRKLGFTEAGRRPAGRCPRRPAQAPVWSGASPGNVCRHGIRAGGSDRPRDDGARAWLRRGSAWTAAASRSARC
jgi:RimJ/RimL family protein N-acetyltransferase